MTNYSYWLLTRNFLKEILSLILKVVREIPYLDRELYRFESHKMKLLDARAAC